MSTYNDENGKALFIQYKNLFFPFNDFNGELAAKNEPQNFLDSVDMLQDYEAPIGVHNAGEAYRKNKLKTLPRKSHVTKVKVEKAKALYHEGLVLLKSLKRNEDEARILVVLRDRGLTRGKVTPDKTIWEKFKPITQEIISDKSTYDLGVRMALFRVHISIWGLGESDIIAIAWALIITGTNQKSNMTFPNGMVLTMRQIFEKDKNIHIGTNYGTLFRYAGNLVVERAMEKKVASWLQNYAGKTSGRVYPGYHFYGNDKTIMANSMRASLTHRVAKNNVIGQLSASQISGTVEEVMKLVRGRNNNGDLTFNDVDLIEEYKRIGIKWDTITETGGLASRAAKVLEVLSFAENPEKYKPLLGI